MKRCFILLVEDDENDVFFVTDALRRVGIELPIEVANDGQQAIDILAQAGNGVRQPGSPNPCFVLLDLNLPRRTGLEVLDWIRQDSSWKTLPVIVLTSSTSEMDMKQAYAQGANSYVIKPSDGTKLREFAQLLKQYWLGWNQCPSFETGTS